METICLLNSKHFKIKAALHLRYTPKTFRRTVIKRFPITFENKDSVEIPEIIFYKLPQSIHTNPKVLITKSAAIEIMFEFRYKYVTKS